jgi:hypothetical protein
MSVYSILFNFLYQLKKASKLNKPWIKSIIFFPKYYRYAKNKSSTLELELPWITFEALGFLNNLNLKDIQIFEYGSGGSSLYFSNRGAHVISIEHNKDWFLSLKSILSKIENKLVIDLRLIEPEKESQPTVFSENDKNYAGYSFKKYSDSILQYPEGLFDLIVIDGRARPFCLYNSISKVKDGGYILFDNSNRVSYHYELEKISDWLVSKSYGPTVNDLSFNETSIYRKPFFK